MSRLLPLAVALLLAACAQVPPVPSEHDGEAVWRARQQTLAALPPWVLTGRIAINTEDEAWHATLRWQQSGDAYAIQFVGPLGQGVIRLQGDSGGVSLQMAKDEVYTAASPEALLREHLGWQVPVKGLRYWAVGLLAPDQPARHELDPQGRLTLLRQSGWEIAYRRYMRVGAIDLPAKIFMNNPRLDVRLVVDNWQLMTARRSAGSNRSPDVMMGQ